MDKVRVAVVGAGAFGANHLRVLHELPAADLVAVVDSEPARAIEVAAKYNCSAIASLAELTGKVDAAVVAVPTSAHASVGCQLLEQGIDVLVEKPIAPTLADAERLIAASES
ncbi:MAG TPA: Gfo/Idh/MocA family oxidoreductase, partial [Bryobacteraceae bacterium]|nr:Gfo/Idh/MocA family oxidoreductase [Bryobacteraceae bacterium]